MKWTLPIVTLLCGLVGGWLLSGASSGGSAEFQSYSAAEQGVAKSTVQAGAGGADGVVEAEGAFTGSQIAGGIEDEWLESLADMDDFERIGAIHSRVKNLQADQFEQLLEGLDLISNTYGWQLRSMIGSRWAELDPQGLLAYIDTQTTQKQWGWSNALFSSWGRSDPAAAMAAAKGLASRNLQMNAIRAIAQAMAQEDPRGAIELLAGGGVNLQPHSWALRNVYESWARQDPAQARQAALALEDGVHKTQALAGVMSEWMAEDPIRALEWLDSLPIDGAVHQSQRQIFQELLNRDFEVARSYVEGKTNPLERRKVLEGLYFHNLAWQKEPAEMREIYDWLGMVATGQMYDNKVSDFVRSLASVDPEGTREFAMSLPDGNARLNALRAFAGELARVDPEGAIAFAQSLEYADERQRVLSSISWQLTNASVVDAARLVAMSADPEVQQRLVGRIGDQWSQFDLVTSLDWARGLSDEDARITATQAVLKNWAQADTDAAFAYISQVTDDESRQAGIYQSIFGEWAREDPEAAVVALDRLPEGEAFDASKSNIYRSVANTYVSHDPMAASEWIATLDSGPARDQSVQTLVNSISRSDPEAGFIWAATVEDLKIRKNSLNQSVREWAKLDPDAADRAISDAEFPAAEKEQLFKLVERQRQ